MEVLAAILTLISVFFTVRSHIICWPIGILASLVYMYVFDQEHIYFQLVLQIVFIIQSIHGWYYWRRVDKIKLKNSTWLNLAIHLTIILFLTGILTLIFQKTDNPQLTLDILTSLLSLLGMWYLATRNIFAWLVWVVADIFFILMFMDLKMFWSAGLYIILLGLSIKGLIQWGKNLETD